jgi:hypothetical protein
MFSHQHSASCSRHSSLLRLHVRPAGLVASHCHVQTFPVSEVSVVTFATPRHVLWLADCVSGDPN